jgi:hypothetical protein
MFLFYDNVKALLVVHHRIYFHNLSNEMIEIILGEEFWML